MKTYKDTSTTRVMGPNGAPPSRILVVDDDGMIRDMLKEILEREKYCIDLSESSGDALEKLIDYKYSLLLLDANLPGISGFELLKYCKKHHPLMEIIMITGNPELDDAISTVKDGAFDYIAKPFSVEKLVTRVKDALKHQKQQLIKSLSTQGNNLVSKTGTPQTPLPDYRVIKTLGAGTMGVVLLVEKDKKYYALKILRKEGNESNHSLRIKRFLREAKILSQIEHPNVVKVFDSDLPEEDVSTPYILMEYVDGKPLTDFIKQDSFNLEQKLYIIGQIASALAIVHKFGVLHRDVKPSNILVTEDYVAKLSDFGIAKISDSSLTMTHEVLGSPAYMPPEIFKPNKLIDSRSDIFSLGILSYELITGEKPFHGETVSEMMDAIQKSKPKEPKKLVPDLPMPIQKLLENMLRKNPEDRFQNASEIVETINSLGRKESMEDTVIRPKGFLRSILPAGKVWS
jgi:FixJ family two-component response regulator/tRNA A-37 threonylcarbamoyl transferase component Bud32